MFRSILWMVFAATLGLAAAGCGGHGADSDATAGAPAPAMLAAEDVAVAARTDLAAGVPVSGVLEPARDVSLTAPVADVLEAVLVQEGQAVSRGQVLARFRTSGTAPAAAGAEAQRRAAQSEYQRMKNLFAEGAVSERDVERAEAQVRAAEAEAAQAGKRLRESTVRAPFAGVVAERRVQAGDRVGDGDPLFRIVNVSELEFEATVPAEHADRIAPGAPVTLTVSGLADRRLEGRVARVNATADAATRQVRVYVTVPNRDRGLVGGLHASGVIVLARAGDVLAVPQAAVRGAGSDSTHAWAVAGGRVERRALALGVVDEQRGLVEVTRGLAAGDTVIVGPVEGLATGQPIQVAGAGKER